MSTTVSTPRKIAATVTASATLAKGRHTPVDATSGAPTMTLPTDAVAGVELSVEKIDASTNAVNVTGTLRGVASQTISLTSQYDARTFLSEGSGSWRPISDHRTKASLDVTYARAGDGSQDAAAALPNIVKAVRSYNDNTGGTFRTIGLGSSVGLGPNGGIDPVNSVSAKLHAALTGAFNRLGNLTWTHTNGSVGGSIIFDGVTTHYAAAKTTAGGTPNVVTFAYGMNDGQAAQYHAGQTYPGVYTNLVNLIKTAQADGADCIVVTSPHPHSTRNTYAMPNGVTPSYPAAGVQKPDATSAQSVISVVSPSGATVPAHYRHLRVNQAMRQAAIDTGSILIDAEPYWFDAIAAYGEDALFNTGEYVHPNLLGFQQTYHKAISKLAAGLTASSIIAPAPIPVAAAAATADTVVVKSTNETRTTTTRTTDTQLRFTAPASSVWEIDWLMHGTVPTANDADWSIETPTGSTGRFDVNGPATTETTVAGTGVSRSSTIASYLNTGGNTTDWVVRVHAVVHVGSTGGQVGLQYSIDAGTGTLTVYADSMMRARRLS